MARLAAAVAAYEAAAGRPRLEPLPLLEAHEALGAELLAGGRPDAAAARGCLPAAGRALERMKHEHPQDAEVAIYYRTAAELYMWAGAFVEAHGLLTDAADLLKDGGAEYAEELQVCRRMLAACARRLPGPAAAGAGLPPAAPPVGPALALRPLAPGDAVAVARLAAAAGEGQALPTGPALNAYLEANADLCLAAADPDGELLGSVVAITDGSFGYLRQPLIDRATCGDGAATAEALLLEQAEAALRVRGVHSIHSLGVSTLERDVPTHLVYAL